MGRSKAVGHDEHQGMGTADILPVGLIRLKHVDEIEREKGGGE